MSVYRRGERKVLINSLRSCFVPPSSFRALLQTLRFKIKGMPALLYRDVHCPGHHTLVVAAAAARLLQCRPPHIAQSPVGMSWLVPEENYWYLSGENLIKDLPGKECPTVHLGYFHQCHQVNRAESLESFVFCFPQSQLCVSTGLLLRV